MERRLNLRLGVCFVVTVGLCSCITKPNARLIHKVKSVAVIGFTVLPQRDVTLHNIDNTFQSAGKLYKLVGRSLANTRKWRVVPLETLQRQHTYQSLFDKYGAHLLSSDLRASGILSQEEQVNLSPHDREDLRKALNVDGLISLAFVLTRRPPLPTDSQDMARLTAKTTFDLYAGSGANTVWQISSLPAKMFATPVLPADLSFADGDEKDFADAVMLALATMLQQRKAEESTK